MCPLTFCVRVMSPERHQWKPAVLVAAVMLRTPPVDDQSLASQPRPVVIYGAQCWKCPRHPPVTNQQRAHTPSKLGFALCCHSNATGAPIANPPNSAQLEAASTTPPSYIRVRAVVWAYCHGQTDTQTRVTTIHFASSTTHTKCNYKSNFSSLPICHVVFLRRYSVMSGTE